MVTDSDDEAEDEQNNNEEQNNEEGNEERAEDVQGGVNDEGDHAAEQRSSTRGLLDDLKEGARLAAVNFIIGAAKYLLI